MRPRKNVANMTVAERQAFANAVIAVHSKPSQRGLNNRYDDYVRIHTDAMNVTPSWGHGGPAFTAWHRVLLAKFEGELRQIDDTIRIPFWDWTVDRTATSPPWSNDLLGGDGGMNNPPGSQSGEVTTGPFRHSAGNWNITTGQAGTNDDPFNRPYLARGFGRRQDALQLPTPQNQVDTLAETFYSQFVFDLEVILHNLVHRWVNGQMLLRASPLDPVFWLHHCNIDRLWGMWMRGKANADRYTAALGDPSYHQPNGTMIFHDPAVGPATPPWTGSYKPVDVIADHPFDVWYEGDPPIVTLETPSVSFKDVELGRTTYAAVTFKVEAVDTVGFEVLSAVPGPFGLPAALNPPPPVPPGDTAQTGRVWLSFTATGLGAVTPITVTVRCIQTGQVFNVPVTANVVPVKTAAAALVADRSGSMAQDAGNGLDKHQKLVQSLGIVAGLVRDQDQLALVTFDDQHDTPIPLGDALAAGAGGTRDQLNAVAASGALDPRGLTGIGAGIQLGVSELAGATADTVALVVVTDGVENVPPTIASVAGSITSRTYAIGIGRPSDVNTAALTAICQGNDGYLLVTGDLAGEELFRLHKYFLQIHAGVTNSQIVTDPEGELTPGAVHTVPFVLTGADIDADVVVVCPLPQVVDVVLEAPDGSTYDAASGVATVAPLEGTWLTGLRLNLPVLPGVHGGTWKALLSIDEKKLSDHDPIDTDLDALRGRGAVPYSLVVTSRSDLSLEVTARRDRDVALITATLQAHGIPFWDEARVLGLVTDPAGVVTRVPFDPLGDGRYQAKVGVPDPGLYTARVMARGAIDGDRFTREQTVSIATVSGEASPGAEEPDVRPRPPKLRRRRPFVLDTGLRAARAPEPPPAPKPVSAAALARHRHGHGDDHFPSPDQVARPEPWEEAAKSATAPKPSKATSKKAGKATKAAKASKSKKATKKSGRGEGHDH